METLLFTNLKGFKELVKKGHIVEPKCWEYIITLTGNLDLCKYIYGHQGSKKIYNILLICSQAGTNFYTKQSEYDEEIKKGSLEILKFFLKYEKKTFKITYNDISEAFNYSVRHNNIEMSKYIINSLLKDKKNIKEIKFNARLYLLKIYNDYLIYENYTDVDNEKDILERFPNLKNIHNFLKN